MSNELDHDANQCVRNRIEVVLNLDVMIEVNPRAPPFRLKPFGAARSIFSNKYRRFRRRQRMVRSFMRCMRNAMALVHSASEKSLRAQLPENVVLSKSDARLALSRLVRSRRKESD